MAEDPARAEGAPIEVHLKDYLRVVRKHAGIAVAFFVIVTAAVAVATFRSPRVYRATATLSIERQAPSAFALEDFLGPERPQDEYRRTQQELLRSRPIVAGAFRKLGLNDHGLFREAPDGVEAFLERIQVTPREGTYLVDVSVDAEDRARVADWVNGLVDEYVNYTELRYYTTSRQAEERITERIPELREKLLESEKALRDYLEENNVVAFDKQLDILYRKLDTLEARLTSVETERIRVDAACRVLRENTNGSTLPHSMPEIATSDVLLSLLRQEAALVEAFAQTEAKYKSPHPRYLYAREQIEGLRKRIEEEVGRILADLEARLEVKRREKEQLQEMIAGQNDRVRALEEKSSRVEALRQEVESNRRMYNEFTERRKEIESASKLGRTDVDVVERARPPQDPVRPKTLLNLTLAAVVGILGGVALTFFVEYLDDSLKSPEEVEALETPLLGVVPEIAEGEEKADRALACLKRPKALPAEAFRAIRTSLTFAQAEGREARIYVVTSAGPMEGKSLNAINVAVAMARADQKILLVDADMRKPNLHNLLGLPDGLPGLSGFFAGSASFDEVLVEGPLENLTVVPCGDIPPNPSELLGSPRLARFLEAARERFDRVIFDTPPAVAVTDALVLASSVDAVIFVVRAERTSRKTAARSLDEFRRLGGRVAGIVLNDFNPRKAGYYSGGYSPYSYYDRRRAGKAYGYGYGYGEETDGPDGGRSPRT